jgi:hypothetical protein
LWTFGRLFGVIGASSHYSDVAVNGNFSFLISVTVGSLKPSVTFTKWPPLVPEERFGKLGHGQAVQVRVQPSFPIHDLGHSR